MPFTPWSGSSGSAGIQPYQFQPETYGALGNGIIGTGGTGTSGLSTLTDAGASFTSADVGKFIVINQGANGAFVNPLCTTISSVGGPTSVTLAAPFTANAANAPYVYGTDDAAAINAAVTAAANYAQANQGKAQVIFGAKIYALGAVTHPTAPIPYNCHIQLPAGTQLGKRLDIELIGVGEAPASVYWESTAPDLAGTTLMSMIFPPNQPDGTFGSFSVVGGPNATTGLGPGNFANVKINWQGITVCAPFNSQAIGVDGVRLAQLNVPHGRALAFAPVNFSGASVGGPYLSSSTGYVTNDQGIGFRFPTWLNNAFSYVGHLVSQGFSIGVDIAEHFMASEVIALYGDRAVQVSNLSSGAHAGTISHLLAEQLNHLIFANNCAIGANYPLSIMTMDSETIATDHLNDPNNALNGICYFSSGTSGHPVASTGAASSFTFIDIFSTASSPPGHWASPPAVPASTVAQQNTAYRQAWVSIHTGAGVTVSVIAVDGTTTGLTIPASSSAAVFVPSGKNITLTYAGGTPTWDWWLA